MPISSQQHANLADHTYGRNQRAVDILLDMLDAMVRPSPSTTS